MKNDPYDKSLVTPAWCKSVVSDCVSKGKLSVNLCHNYSDHHKLQIRSLQSKKLDILHKLLAICCANYHVA